MAHHDPNRPSVAEVIPMVRALYDGDAECTTGAGLVGGHLHIVLDDGNIETGHVDFCLNSATVDNCDTCMRLAQKLKAMSPTQRCRVYREKWL